jgi:hypothetical protein
MYKPLIYADLNAKCWMEMTGSLDEGECDK